MVIFCLFPLSGCLTRAGIAEFTAYNSTFEESAAVSAAIIDQLAASERIIGRYSRLEGNTITGKRFIVADAAYFSDEIDPPLAAHYRKALDVIGRYNTIMLGYATGQGFEQLQAEIFALAAESAETADLIAGTTAISEQFIPYVHVLREFANFGVGLRSRAIFRQKALEYHDDIVSLIKTMRDGTPEVFDVLVDPVEQDIIHAVANGQNTAKLQEKHLELRILVSDWVVLMDRNIDALNAVIHAIENPRLGSDLSGATSALIELQTTVTAVRKRLAEINAS